MRQSKAFTLTAGLMILLSGCPRPGGAITALNEDEPPFSQEMRKALNISIRITHGTGISAAVIIPGHGKWIGTAGCSEPSKPISPDMVFNIASIGKNFIAILVCRLAQEGRLSFDDPLSKWLPDYPNIDNTITIRQLLNHTSGIFDWVDHPLSPYRRSFNALEASSPEEVVTRLVNKPYFSPGGGFHYSSTNYTLLGMIVEQTTGSSVGKEIRTRFLEPLDLRRTVVLDRESRVPETMNVAHAWLDTDGNGALEDISSWPITWIATRSPALMYSTAEDLARWSQAVYGGKALDQALLKQVLAFHRPAPHTPFDAGYGLGTQELRLCGLEMWGHLGWQYGYTSSMLYIPRHSASVVVLINDNNMMLINMAAIALLMIMEFHLETVRFLLLSGSVSVLLSIFVLWPLNSIAQYLRKRRGRFPVLRDTKSQKGRMAYWIVFFLGISIAAAAIFYFVYALNPVTRLSWSGGNFIVRTFIVLSITSAVIALSLIYLSIDIWKNKLCPVIWRVYYTLVILAGLIVSYSLLRLIS